MTKMIKIPSWISSVGIGILTILLSSLIGWTGATLFQNAKAIEEIRVELKLVRKKTREEQAQWAKMLRIEKRIEELHEEMHKMFKLKKIKFKTIRYFN